jgi:putative transposase
MIRPPAPPVNGAAIWSAAERPNLNSRVERSGTCGYSQSTATRSHCTGHAPQQDMPRVGRQTAAERQQVNSRGWSAAEPTVMMAPGNLSRVSGDTLVRAMSNTYTQLLFHVVYSTKNRQRTLSHGPRETLYRYIWGIHKNLDCHLYRIGGTDDHVHILTATTTTLSLADFVKEVKTGSSRWLKQQPEFPRFEGWQDGYGAFTVSFAEKDAIVEYIKRQEEHHRRESLLDEYRRLLAEHGVPYDERYLA